MALAMVVAVAVAAVPLMVVVVVVVGGVVQTFVSFLIFLMESQARRALPTSSQKLPPFFRGLFWAEDDVGERTGHARHKK